MIHAGWYYKEKQSGASESLYVLSLGRAARTALPVSIQYPQAKEANTSNLPLVASGKEWTGLEGIGGKTGRL
jgi:hypothetical protein